MIIGIGTDIVEISRIQTVFDKQSEIFLDRILTQDERATFEERRASNRHIQFLATRFAAKEACAKALGCGFRGGVKMKEIGIIHDEKLCPHLVLTGEALKTLEAKIVSDQMPHLHVSLSDEKHYAVATVIAELK
jgi:holo-[acyl-carrier protein] synthase